MGATSYVTGGNTRTVANVFVPLTFAGLFAVLSLVDQSSYGLGPTATATVAVISAAIALMLISPWLTVVVCALVVIPVVLAKVTFFGVAALLLPLTAGYMVVRGWQAAAYVFMTVVAFLLSGALITVEVSRSVLVSSILFWTVAGVIAVGGGHLVHYFVQREANLKERNRQVLDELRTELSRELHDSVGGVLTRVSLLAQQARMSNPEQTSANLNQIVAETNVASGEVRLLLSRLRALDDRMLRRQRPRRSDVTAPDHKQSTPEGFSTRGIPRTVHQSIRRFSEQLSAYGFNVTTHTDPAALDELGRHSKVISRLFHEALLNTVKYADPNEAVSVTAALTGPRTVEICLSNQIADSYGNHTDSSGFGLGSLSREVATAGGTLTTTHESTGHNMARWTMRTVLPVDDSPCAGSADPNEGA